MMANISFKSSECESDPNAHTTSARICARVLIGTIRFDTLPSQPSLNNHFGVHQPSPLQWHRGDLLGIYSGGNES